MTKNSDWKGAIIVATMIGFSLFVFGCTGIWMML